MIHTSLISAEVTQECPPGANSAPEKQRKHPRSAEYGMIILKFSEAEEEHDHFLVVIHPPGVVPPTHHYPPQKKKKLPQKFTYSPADNGMLWSLKLAAAVMLCAVLSNVLLMVSLITNNRILSVSLPIHELNMLMYEAT